MRIVLDTHALVWLCTDDRRLGRRSSSLADASLARGELYASAVTFWEVAVLTVRGRLRRMGSAEELRRAAFERGLRELPLTGDVAIAAAGLSLRGDPADRFIAATAIAHDAVLVTADERLLEWKHPRPRRDDARR